jgi:hypothetical protein
VSGFAPKFLHAGPDRWIIIGGARPYPEHGDHLLARGAALVITDIRELQTAVAKLHKHWVRPVNSD